MLKTYYALTKPGIIYGNLLAAAAGFLLASKGHVNFELLLAALGGTSLIIASGCVFNNFIDRGIDKKMARTNKRALVQGTVSGRNALIYASILGLAGFLILAVYTNKLTVYVGAVGFIVYVALYGIAKRRSVWGTVIGSVSGATPPLAGYLAVTNHFDSGAVLLFLILTLWQMPHFYAIAMYRRKDYAAASIPVLPVVKGMRHTKVQILLYIVGFMAVCTLLTSYGHTGYTYLVVMLGVGTAWLRLGVRGFKASDDTRWARKMFGFSLIVLLTFCAMISIDVVLP